MKPLGVDDWLAFWRRVGQPGVRCLAPRAHSFLTTTYDPRHHILVPAFDVDSLTHTQALGMLIELEAIRLHYGPSPKPDGVTKRIEYSYPYWGEGGICLAIVSVASPSPEEERILNALRGCGFVMCHEIDTPDRGKCCAVWWLPPTNRIFSPTPNNVDFDLAGLIATDPLGPAP